MATEKRLIEANKIYDAVERRYKVSSGIEHRCERDFLDMICSADTVDAVEVIRCKDCVHWYEPEGVCLKIYSDGAVSPYAWQDRNPDDFCSYGERKDNG